MLKLKKSKIKNTLKKSKIKNTLKKSKINVKFYYRPFWWNIRYVRWVHVGKRKFPSTTKKYKRLKVVSNPIKQKRNLFFFKKLSRQYQLTLHSVKINKLINKPNYKNFSKLSNFLENLHCILNKQQSIKVIKNGWVFVNGQLELNPSKQLKSSDIVTISPLAWKRLQIWFWKFYPIPSKKKKIRKRRKKLSKQVLKYKNYQNLIIFRKINSLAFSKK